MKKFITTVFVVALATTSFAALQDKHGKKDADSSRLSKNERIIIKVLKFKPKVEKSFKEVLMDWLLKFE